MLPFKTAAAPSPKTQTPTEAKEIHPLILDVPSTLEKSVKEIEKSLGKGTNRIQWKANRIEHLPYGGESRDYHRGKYQFILYFDKNGVAKGFMSRDDIDVIEKEGYLLDQWESFLARFGLAVSKPPDVKAPAARRWNNFNGYKIILLSTQVGGPVWSVQILKVQ